MAAPNTFKNNTPCRNVTTKGLSMKSTRIEINSSRCRRSRIAVITCLENAREVCGNGACQLHAAASSGRDRKDANAPRAGRIRLLLHLPSPRDEDRRLHRLIVDFVPNVTEERNLCALRTERINDVHRNAPQIKVHHQVWKEP